VRKTGTFRTRTVLTAKMTIEDLIMKYKEECLYERQRIIETYANDPIRLLEMLKLIASMQELALTPKPVILNHDYEHVSHENSPNKMYVDGSLHYRDHEPLRIGKVIHRMHPIVDSFTWNMRKDYISDAGQDVDDKHIPLTKETLDTIVHPSSDWILMMEFDERALSKKEADVFNGTFSEMTQKDEYGSNVCKTSIVTLLKIRRQHIFKKTSTLRDVLDCIQSGPVYGYYEGIEDPSPRHFANFEEDLPAYEVSWGT